MIREQIKIVWSGYVMIVVLAAVHIACGYGLFVALRAMSVGGIVVGVIAVLIVLICWAGLFMVHPNEAKVLQLFGKYVGTTHEPGLKWANPFFCEASHIGPYPQL